mmetsp:Transcript_81956/g.258593  ORF Transcript_81956/g.258593 Transcript_81956/m.258593 type:complete len:98 (+) Transcript_81956:509-802(+)
MSWSSAPRCCTPPRRRSGDSSASSGSARTSTRRCCGAAASWGPGFQRAAERWELVNACFEVTEELDAEAAGFTVIEGTTVAVLRRRREPLKGEGLPC